MKNKLSGKSMLHNATSSNELSCVEKLQKLRAEATSVRNGLRHVVANVYAVALHIKRDKKSWKAFCSDEFWSDKPWASPKYEDKATILPSALRITFGQGRDRDSRVSRYKKRLAPFFAKDASPEAVLKALRSEGLNPPKPPSGSKTPRVKTVVVSDRLKKKIEKCLRDEQSLTIKIRAFRRPDARIELDLQTANSSLEVSWDAEDQ